MNKEQKLWLGIDHPAVAAKDVDALAAWYCDVLGYEYWKRSEKPVWMLKAPDNTLLEIMPQDETPRQERTTWTPGWSHLAIRVSNIQEAIQYLDQKNININWQGDVIEAVGGGKVRSFFDLEENMVQIVERDSISKM